MGQRPPEASCWCRASCGIYRPTTCVAWMHAPNARRAMLHRSYHHRTRIPLTRIDLYRRQCVYVCVCISLSLFTHSMHQHYRWNGSHDVDRCLGRTFTYDLTIKKISGDLARALTERRLRCVHFIIVYLLLLCPAASINANLIGSF